MHYESISIEKVNDSRVNESTASIARSKRKRTLDDYEFVITENGKFKTSELGKGSYGVVKKVRDKHSGKIYAMKIMTKKLIFEHSTKENLKREINIQRGIVHPHVIKLYTYFEDAENVYLILEYAENGSLFHYLRKKKRLLENEAFVYFFQTCLGIDYLHKRNIIHRDLKPENLLLDEEGNIKLCDFGWSADTSTKRHTFCGTLDYMAPEMIKNHPHDHRLDIWCLGILLYEMLHGYAPFKGRNDQEKTNNISMNAPISFDPTLSPEAVDLIKRILKPVPINRLPMNEIFQHPWMRMWEKEFDINIKSYVEQQDEQIRELRRMESVSSSASKKNSIFEPNESVYQQTETSSYMSPKQSNSAKIITILDQSSPLNIQRVTNEENKKLSYIDSTKGSESGSIGSGQRSSQLSGEHLLKDHRVKLEDKSATTVRADVGRQISFESANSPSYLSNNSYRPYMNSYSLTPKEYSKYDETNYEINLEKYRKNPTPYALYQKKGSAQYSSNMYQSGKKENRPNGEISYPEMKDVRSRSVDKRFQPEFSLNDNSYTRYAPNKYSIFEEKDEELDHQKSSFRASMKSMKISKQHQPNNKDTKELGLFERILVGLGCIHRDNNKH